MTADGQLGLDGSEQVDPRVLKAARALWWRDARRAWAIDGNDVAREQAKNLWPRVEKNYVEAARTALEAADRA
jgi:hypothetical protein